MTREKIKKKNIYDQKFPRKNSKTKFWRKKIEEKNLKNVSEKDSNKQIPQQIKSKKISDKLNQVQRAQSRPVGPPARNMAPEVP